jgi:hypothetical protein
MSVVIAALLFLFGVSIAVLSAYLVLERKRGRQWYALPSCYCILVGVIGALVTHKRIDITAIVFFSTILTLIGLITVRFELRRR